MSAEASAPLDASAGALAAAIRRRVHDPVRLAAVRDTGLLDTAADEPFDRLARLAAAVLDAPFAFVTVVDERRSFWKACIGVDATSPADRQNTVEESFCQYVIGLDDELVVGDVTLDPRTRDNPSIASMGVRAWAGFPLRAPGGEALGSFCVVDTQTRVWTDRDVEIIRTLAAAASGEVALRARAEHAATLARTLQQALLPPVAPHVPFLDVGAIYRAAEEGTEVMGDFYDLFETADGRWNAVLGDVRGKGVAAARVTALARYAVRAGSMRERSPAAVLGLVNETLRLAGAEEERFVSAILASFDAAADGVHVQLACAGHVPAILRSASGVRLVNAPGGLLGVWEDACLRDERLLLAPGDVLVLYTDGVTEAHDEQRSPFGEQRLMDVVARAPAAGQGVADAIAEAVLAHAGPLAQDDIAILAVRVNPDAVVA